MTRDFSSEMEAHLALIGADLDQLPVEMKPVLGGRVQPVLVCSRYSDVEVVNALGFAARLEPEYSVD